MMLIILNKLYQLTILISFLHNMSHFTYLCVCSLHFLRKIPQTSIKLLYLSDSKITQMFDSNLSPHLGRSPTRQAFRHISLSYFPHCVLVPLNLSSFSNFTYFWSGSNQRSQNWLGQRSYHRRRRFFVRSENYRLGRTVESWGHVL